MEEILSDQELYQTFSQLVQELILYNSPATHNIPVHSRDFLFLSQFLVFLMIGLHPFHTNVGQLQKTMFPFLHGLVPSSLSLFLMMSSLPVLVAILCLLLQVHLLYLLQDTVIAPAQFPRHKRQVLQSQWIEEWLDWSVRCVWKLRLTLPYYHVDMLVFVTNVVLL